MYINMENGDSVHKYYITVTERPAVCLSFEDRLEAVTVSHLIEFLKLIMYCLIITSTISFSVFWKRDSVHSICILN